MPAMLSVSRVQSAMLERQTIRGVWTADQYCCELESVCVFEHPSVQTMFELHGSQSMGPLTYFHYPIRPILLRKTWAQRAPTLIFL